MDAGGGPGSGGVQPRRHATHGRVVVLSGPSAVGKSTVVRCLREQVPDLHFSVSVTTRAPRPGEVDGVDYHFVSPTEFQQLIDNGDLLEWADIHGGLHRSGTPARPVANAAEVVSGRLSVSRTARIGSPAASTWRSPQAQRAALVVSMGEADSIRRRGARAGRRRGCGPGACGRRPHQ